MTPTRPRRPEPIMDEVKTLLARGRRRLRERRMVRGGVFGLWGGLTVALGVAALSRFWWQVPVEAHWVALGVVPLGVVVGVLVGAAPAGLSPREVALVLDRRLGTDELLVTALHVLKQPETWAHNKVLDDLQAALPDLPSTREALPARPPGRSGWLLALAALAAVLFFVPQRAGARWTPEPETPVQEEAARLEERLAELDEEYEVELPSDIEAEVEELVNDLRGDALDDVEARERIDDLQEQLEQLQKDLERSKDLLQDLEEAADELSQNPDTREMADAMEQGDMDGASEAAKDLAEMLSEASPEQRRAAGEALEKAGERLGQSADEGLRQAGNAMERAGQQLQQGEGQEGQQGEGQEGQQGEGQQGGEQGEGQQGGEQGEGQQGGEQGEGQQGGEQGEGQQGGEQSGSGGGDLQSLAEELERQQELADQLQSDEQMLSRSQELNGALEGAEQRLGGEAGVAQGSSSSGGGEGEGQGEGQPVSDYGTGHTWEDGGSGEADPFHHDASRQTDRTEGQEVDDFEQLYDPIRLQGAETLMTSVDGQIDEDGHIDHLPTRLTGAEEDAAAPLLKLPEGYREAADQEISAERVPPGYREAVKEYFDSME